MIAGSIATMEARRYRKNRKHWGEPPAVASLSQSIDTIFCRIFSPAVVSSNPRTTNNKNQHITCLKNKEMKGGRA
jgi:hypothetical protein